MPKCSYCHHDISSFDADICPYCGEKNPIAKDYKTKDVTSFVDPLNEGFTLYRARSKKTMVILMATVGMFGAPYFYIGKKANGFLCLFSSLFIIALIGLLLYFFALPNALAFLIPFFALWVIYALFSLFLIRSDSLKDGNGEFLR